MQCACLTSLYDPLTHITFYIECLKIADGNLQFFFSSLYFLLIHATCIFILIYPNHENISDLLLCLRLAAVGVLIHKMWPWYMLSYASWGSFGSEPKKKQEVELHVTSAWFCVCLAVRIRLMMNKIHIFIDKLFKSLFDEKAIKSLIVVAVDILSERLFFLATRRTIFPRL